MRNKIIREYLKSELSNKGKNRIYVDFLCDNCGSEHKCSECGYDEIIEILQVHHKDLYRSNTVDNLQILCPNCHMKYHFLTKTGLYANLKND